MKCSKCGSNNVNIQAVTHIKNKKHGLIYWLLIGWWLELLMWIFLTIPWLIIKIFKPNKVTSKTHSQAVCQNCGKTWRV
ncbi:hypothetical protein HAHI6034_04980 [Hathewaya histolytica]|uniref:Uncharacterized protein n=1 Tax=Hathewaya histolytica TaxID=1498 RepID=A0A4U9R6E7_HATHI|nr:hypothetical protein [Hathewaya histolytica]VTQ87012.1 Uncharacterised protein [Hathewaya histolytica]